MKSGLIGLCLLALSGIAHGQVQHTDPCSNAYDINWVLGTPDGDTPHPDFGGFVMTFKPHFKLQRFIRYSLGDVSFAVTSSKEGELLFYSNGCAIYDPLDSIIQNGDHLNPGEIYDEWCLKGYDYPGLNNMIILPDGYRDSIYYLLHFGINYNQAPNASILIQSEHYYATTIQVGQDPDQTLVISKNVPLLSDTSMLGGPVDAVRHANGLDWWIIHASRYDSTFYRFIVDAEGPRFDGIQQVGPPIYPSNDGGQGKFSPDGSLFVWYHPKFGIRLYDMDRSTGLLSNYRHLPVGIDSADFVGGLAFSPSGRFLYVCTWDVLWQMDLHADLIPASAEVVGIYDGFGDPFPQTFYKMQQTPDGRIFMSHRNGTRNYHAIQEPDKKGMACRFEQHAIQFPTYNNLTIPQFPNYRLGALGDPPCEGPTTSVTPGMDPVAHGLTLYPNPAYDAITVACSDNMADIRIFDTRGVPVHASRPDADRVTITTEGWAPGLYVLTVRTQSGTLTTASFMKI